MVEKDYDGVVCQMRFYFRRPEWEMLPRDDNNYVPAIYKCVPHMPFRLASPYPLLLDPTRRLHYLTRLHIAPRDELEMHHFSFVRADIRPKLMNVTNRGNYEDVELFYRRFQAWKPGDAVIHPHPYFRKLWQEAHVCDNEFGIDLAPFQ